MVFALTARMLRTTDPRLLWKFGWNFGFKGMRSVQRFKKRLEHGQVFPPFLYVSIINSCNLRCTGCWVVVAAPRANLSFEELDRMVRQPDRTDRPVLDEARQGADGVLHRHRRLRVVELDDVDVVGPEAAQARLDVGSDRRR